MYLNYKNMPLFQLVLNSLPLGLGILVKYAFFRKIGFGKDYIDGLKEGFKTAKQCRKVKYDKKHLKNYLAIEWGYEPGPCFISGNFGGQAKIVSSALHLLVSSFKQEAINFIIILREKLWNNGNVSCIMFELTAIFPDRENERTRNPTKGDIQ